MNEKNEECAMSNKLIWSIPVWWNEKSMKFYSLLSEETVSL